MASGPSPKRQRGIWAGGAGKGTPGGWNSLSKGWRGASENSGEESLVLAGKQVGKQPWMWGCEMLGPSEGAAAHSKEGAIKHMDCSGLEPVRQIYLCCQLRTVA